MLDTLDIVYRATYYSGTRKIELLVEANTRNDLVKFFLTIMWECKIIEDKKYIRISKVLAKAGKMLFGWKEYLQNKNPLGVKSVGENA